MTAFPGRCSAKARARVAAAASLLLLTPSTASAAVWQWGCVGAVGENQLAFNRGKLVLLSGKAPAGKLEDIVTFEDFTNLPGNLSIAKRISATYSPADLNGGLEKKMSFAADKDKLTLTELSSKLTSRRTKLVMGCRDETTERYRKTYRLERDGQAPATVTLICMEYQLSTRGGRTCR